MAPDENKNLIPDKWERPLAALLAFGSAVLTMLFAGGIGKAWIPYVLGGIASFGTTFKIGVFKMGNGSKGGAAVIVLCLGLAAAPSSGCNKYAGISSAYRVTIMVERGIRAADPHVAAWLRRAKASCKKKHADKAAYDACVKPTKDKARAFVAAGKANRAAQDTIRAAHLGIGKADPMKIAAASTCAALTATGAIGAFVPKVAAAATRLRAIKGVACAL